MAVVKGGTVALIGSGEFLPPIAALDRQLIERLTDSPRVVIVPTASAPDGPAIFQRWADQGVAHFAALGSVVEAVLIATRIDAEDPAMAKRLAGANFIYLSGGKPSYLLETLKGTASWQAIVDVFEAGGVVAGCSAGAMVLGGEVLDFPQIWRTLPGLALAPEVTVIPHFDEIPGILAELNYLFHRRTVVAGVEGTTALVRSPTGWTVLGRGGVSILTPQGRTRFTAGQAVPIEFNSASSDGWI